MFTLVRSIPLRQLFLEQGPIIAVSLLIAELVYKFHSFTLECIAFLATWYIIDAVVTLLSKAWSGQSGRKTKIR